MTPGAGSDPRTLPPIKAGAAAMVSQEVLYPPPPLPGVLLKGNVRSVEEVPEHL